MKIVIVEDQRLFQDALSDALVGRAIDVVGRAGNPTEALQVIDATAPHVAVLDIRLPPTYTDEGLRIAEQVRTHYPQVGLLVLSTYAEAAYAERLLSIEENSHALGYLLKERVGNIAELVDAMCRVAAGEVVIDPHIIDRLMSRRRHRNPLDSLSAHERRILALVAEGRSNLGIAQHLGCQISTVEKHLSVITSKLGVLAVAGRERSGVNVRVLATLTYLREVGNTVGT